MLQQSQKFHPGLGRGGVIDGWPSGHTIVATAMVMAIADYYELPSLWVAAGCLSAYVAIGTSVGEGFRLEEQQEDKKAGVVLSPLAVPDGGGGLRLSLSL